MTRLVNNFIKIMYYHYLKSFSSREFVQILLISIINDKLSLKTASFLSIKCIKLKKKSSTLSNDLIYDEFVDIKMNFYQKTNDGFIYDREFTFHVAVQSHLFNLIHFIDKTKTQLSLIILMSKI